MLQRDQEDPKFKLFPVEHNLNLERIQVHLPNKYQLSGNHPPAVFMLDENLE